MIYSEIVGSGCYIPEKIVKNKDFFKKVFYDAAGMQLVNKHEETIKKFEEITEIKERRYVADKLTTSDIGFFAAKEALDSSDIDKESIDIIMAAHNFGDVKKGFTHTDMVPNIASRIKHKLKIKNPATIAYDIIFGCPGWLQGIIQANILIKSGEARRILIVGAEVLSRVSDPHDRDSMIYADGAGAVILETKESKKIKGILSFLVRTDTPEPNQTPLLYMGNSNKKNYSKNELFLKMDGHKVYEYALKNVPQAIKECIEKAKISIKNISKILIHQANGKMDKAILYRLFKLFNIKEVPEDILPMTISWLGNSSVATLPTLFDLLVKGKLEGHSVKKNDLIVFASVGAGMNINAAVYRIP